MTEKRLGGFWRRGTAFAIDEAILYLFSLLLLPIGGLALELAGHPAGGIAAAAEAEGLSYLSLLYGAAVTAAGMLYFTGFHGAGGQTPGKMLLGLRVVPAAGGAMTFGIAFLRWAGYLLSGVFFGLGFLWIAFDGRKQGWHDKLAATLVVRVGPAAPPGGTAGAPADDPASGPEKWLDKKEEIG